MASSYSSFGLAQPDKPAEQLSLYGKLVAVYRCASLNAQSVAQGKLRFYQRNQRGDGRTELEPGNEVVDLFASPSPEMSGADLIEATVLSTELTGDEFWELAPPLPKRRQPGRVQEFWPLNPGRVTIMPGAKAVEGYKLRVGSKTISYKPEGIHHFRYPNPNDDFYGQGRLTAVARTVMSDESLEKATNALLKRGIRPSGILTVPSTATESEIASARRELELKFEGPENAGRVIIIRDGQKYMVVSLTPQELEALATRRWNEAQIRKAFGVYPVVYGLDPDDESATRENSDVQRELYWFGTVLSIANRLERQITYNLLPRLGYEDIEAEFDFSHLRVFREVRAREARANADLTERGILTINEIRRDMGEDPVPWGDTWYGPLSLIPIASLPEAQNRSKALRSAAEVITIQAERIKELEANPPRALPAAPVQKEGDPVEWDAAKLEELIEAGKLAADDPLVMEMAAVLGEVMEVHGAEALAALGIDIAFDASVPSIAMWLQTKAKGTISETWKTTAAKLHKTLAEGLDAGETVQELAKRVDVAFDGRKNALDVARTEAGEAANRGAHEAHKQAGLEQHRWITARDDAVRDSHAAMEGERVAIGEPFSNGLHYPCDTGHGTPADYVNCRCIAEAEVPGAEKSAEQLDALWRAFDRQLTASEKLVHRVWQRVCDEQHARVSAAMERVQQAEPEAVRS